MKQLLSALFLLTAISTQASIYELISETDKVVVYKDKYDSKYAYIKGLQYDLFQQFTIKDSKGPKWQAVAEEYLENEHDFHEWASYFGERMDGVCDSYFSDPEYAYEAENSWELRWAAVKPTKGSKKTAFYLVEFVTLVYGDKGTCELHDAEYVFENKKVTTKEEAKEIYLGNFSSSLPKFE